MTGKRMRALALAAMLALGWGGGAAAAEVELKIQHFLPATAPAQTELLEPWAAAVAEQSGGRIHATIYPAMQLGGRAPQLIDQVREGVVDIAWTLPSYTPGRFPAISVFELPFMISDAEATSQAVQELYDSEPALQAEFADVHPLFFFTHARGVIHTKSRPVATVADLAGLKIRIPTRPVGDAFQAYGAVPVAMPVPQMPEALAKNVIDGAVVPWEVTTSLKLAELATHHTETPGPRGIYTSVFVLVMNKARYAALPDDLKQVIDANSGMGWARAMGAAWEKAEAPGRDAAIAQGNSIEAMAPPEVERMQALAQPVIASWVVDLDKAGQDGEALLDKARQLVEKYTKPATN